MGKWDCEILKLLAAGYTAKEISEKLNLSKRTVQKYVEFLFAEFKAKNSPHLIAIVIRKKIIQ